jgi:cardiolipin synthase A/B
MIKKKAVRHRAGSYSMCNKIKLVHGGKEFFTLLEELIEQARHCIHFQTYILADDPVGNKIAEALVNAAKRKVEIWLMVDGFASQGLSRPFIQKLEDAGIRFRYFEPLLKSRHFYFGRRMHHKVVVIDGVKAMVGSMNIAERYNDTPDQKAWFDLALYAEGEVAVELHHICNDFWPARRRHILPLPTDVTEQIAAIPEAECSPVRARQNDWVNRRRQATTTYLELFSKSKESIVVVCSYFLPGKQLRTELERAVRRNVKVKVILAGTSDLKIVKLGERYLYRWMLHHDISVYEYQPVVLHAKMAISDHELLTLGSYNVNDLSALASIELNLDVKDKNFASGVQKKIESIIEKDCKPVDIPAYTTRLFSLRQFSRWFAFQLIRFSLTLSTFYFRQKE